MAAKKAAEATEEAKTETEGKLPVEKEKSLETANTGVRKGNRSDGRVQMIYIGPSLPGGKLQSNRVFTGTAEMIQAETQEIVKEYPLAGKMIVPVVELAEKKQKINTPGSIYNKLYKDLLSVKAAKLKETEV